MRLSIHHGSHGIDSDCLVDYGILRGCIMRFSRLPYQRLVRDRNVTTVISSIHSNRHQMNTSRVTRGQVSPHLRKNGISELHYLNHIQAHLRFFNILFVLLNKFQPVPDGERSTFVRNKYNHFTAVPEPVFIFGIGTICNDNSLAAQETLLLTHMLLPMLVPVPMPNAKHCHYSNANIFLCWCFLPASRDRMMHEH